jgi:hypothetical protein
MSEFKKLKLKIRSATSSEERQKLIGSLLSIRGQYKECNKTLINKRKYSQNWRDENRLKVSRYNREYARMRRQKGEVHSEGKSNERISKISFFKEDEKRKSLAK